MDSKYTISPVSLGKISSGDHDPRAGRRKRFAPKSRSGCLICRARRIKCDEEQPSCRRCIKANHDCRYAADKFTHFSTKQVLRDVRAGQAADSDADIIYLKSLLPSYGSLEETDYLGKFLTVSAPWLSKYNDGSFYHTVLPQRSWHHPALRHTLVAIAMATEQTRNAVDFAATKEHHWHHSQALHHVYKAAQGEEEVVLMTSAMMWLHDNIMSNSHTAVVHLQGFLRILNEYRSRRQQLGLPATEFESQLLRGLVFHADVSDNAFAQVEAAAIARNVRRRLQDPRYSQRFPTMDGVCEELRLGLTAVAHSVRPPMERDSEHTDDEDEDESSSITTTELRKFLEKWYRTFSSVSKSSRTDRILLECHYICAALALQVHQIGLSPGSASMTNDQQSLDRLNYVLDRLDEIDVADLEQRPPKKDTALPLCQILAQAIALTNDSAIRRRAYKYLGRVKRVEGLWSTDMVAQMMWISHPPDDAEPDSSPTDSDDTTPSVGVAETAHIWQVPLIPASNEMTPGPAVAMQQDPDTVANTRQEEATAPAGSQTPFETTSNSIFSQVRIPNGTLSAISDRCGSQHLSPMVSEPREEQYVTGLRTSGLLLQQTMLEETMWTKTSLRQEPSEEFNSSLTREHFHSFTVPTVMLLAFDSNQRRDHINYRFSLPNLPFQTSQDSDTDT